MRLTQRIIAITLASVVAISVSAQAVATDLTGTWLMSVVTENGTGTPTVTMKQTGDSLSGTYESPRMGNLTFKGGVKDKAFDFVLATEGGAALTFKGTIVDDDHIKGDVDFGGMGGATFTGVRKK